MIEEERKNLYRMFPGTVIATTVAPDRPGYELLIALIYKDTEIESFLGLKYCGYEKHITDF